jgi:uncharacterized protein YgiM (DUF1202 family)
MRFRIAVLASALAVGLVFSALPVEAALTHTTTNLNLRAGPGTHHRVKAIIPAGAPIDIESCGDAWCYMSWAGHVGYVKHQYSGSSAARSCDPCPQPQAWSDQLFSLSGRPSGCAGEQGVWGCFHEARPGAEAVPGVVCARVRLSTHDSAVRLPA